MAILPLPPEDLRWTAQVSSDDLLPESARESSLIGQQRAEDAITFALPLRRHGYHIYVSGPSGTGRTTYSLRRLRAAARDLPRPFDWLYLPNFDAPDRPRSVSTSAGTAQRFELLLRELRQDIRERLPRAFASEEFAHARRAALEETGQRTEAEFERFQESAKALGFHVSAGPTGLQMAPLRDGRVLSDQEVSALGDAERAELEKSSAQVAEIGQKFLRAAHELEMQGRMAAQALQKELAAFTCRPLFQKVRESIAEAPLQAHVDRLFERIGDWLELFMEPDSSDAQPTTDPGWFRVNTFVAREENASAPVVYEPNPAYYNLLGRIEYTGGPTGLSTDFTHIRAGALHRANGGYLVLSAQALLADRGAYEGLKRALSQRAAGVENIGQHERPVPVADLDPEPVPLDVQVVLIGPERAYHELRELDDQFRKLFKVRADFTADMPNDETHRPEFIAFLQDLQHNHGLLPFLPDGVAAMLEEAARLAGGKRRLSTRLSLIVDLAVESDAQARVASAQAIERAHVQAALRGREERFGQHEERMLELISQGTIHIETRGARVGQVNGLTVLTAGERSFGLPARITARTYAGEQGVIDIEREIALSGPIHTKGVYTLSGYLGWRFGRSRPLALSASLTIEQNYGGIEGDSASSTELYAILSDLANLPVRQEIAVTGSVDQNGRIQPIGGANEKIEGFFAVCCAQGLTGFQGCMIPRQNVDDLMLSEEVVEAARAGRFHIYAVDTIEEGITLLTQVPSGVRADDETYAHGSVYNRISMRLSAYADAVEGKKESDGAGERPA